MKTGIINRIKKIAIQKKLPDGSHYTSISVEQVAHVADLFKENARNVEMTALEENIIPERYVRNMKMFSAKDQLSLLKSRVSVVGLGGLGGAVIEILARTGIGNLNLIDGDSFEDSNLNRQFLSAHSLIGTSKSEAAAKRIKEINSSVIVQEHFKFLDKQNAPGLLNNSNVVVDCLDTIKSRFLLEKTSKEIGSPLVSAAVAGASGHATSIFPEDEGLKLIYGEAEDLPQKGAEASLGCLPQAVTLLASIETFEVVKILLGRGSLLRNKLLVVDLMDNTIDVLDLI